MPFEEYLGMQINLSLAINYTSIIIIRRVLACDIDIAQRELGEALLLLRGRHVGIMEATQQTVSSCSILSEK